MDENEISRSLGDLNEFASQIKELLEIKDREYGFPSKKYKKCFIGSDAVKKIIEKGIASDEDDALSLGNILLNSGFFHHVLKEHEFKNDFLFYRFAEDEDHGKIKKNQKGVAASWSDLIQPIASRKGNISLQANIPEKDLHLGTYNQGHFEEVGVEPLDEHNIKLLDSVHPSAWQDPKAKDKYNLVVIGAGAGGLITAAAAAGMGARVALIESHLLGGDCLNVGCVPSKALLSSAKAISNVKKAEKFGVEINGEIRVNFAKVMERMRKLRAQISPHDSAERFASLGIDIFIGKGKFSGKDTVEVNGQVLKFSKAVIATGATAAIPPIPGLDKVSYLTNANIFNLTKLPRRLAIIGAGPIGMELAQAFQRFGSDVTVFTRSDKILSKEDPEAADIVEDSMIKDGVEFKSNVKYKRISENDDRSTISVEFEIEHQEESLEFDSILIATGRKPNVCKLGLEVANVEFDKRLGVKVNDYLQSSNSNVFAVGDVASQYQFTHMADFMARIVVRNALFLGRDKVSNLLVPWATYTDPEVAHVGLYEKDLLEREIEYQTFKRDFSDVDRSIVDGDTVGFVKIHVKKGSDEILGATIVGSNAGNMISEVSVAIRSGMGLGKLASVIHPYPTSAEAIRQCGDAYNRTKLTPTVKKFFNRLLSFRR
jgi:pyruvate/2-oxoglutarate dehydrogenase complex dihydrolipoamide dehydrogenase (E3) component